jgi:integrase
MFIRVLIDTAFRRGEALILGPHSVTEVTDDDGEVHLCLALPEYMTKSDKPRMVPMTQTLVDMIPALNAQALPDKDTGVSRWFPLDASAWYMWSNIRDDVKKLGSDIDDVGLHTLRHTCITRLALGGMELQRLSMWAGHSDVSITSKRYSHLDVAALLGGKAILSNPANGGKSTPNPDPSGNRNYSVSGGNRAEAGTISLQ